MKTLLAYFLIIPTLIIPTTRKQIIARRIETSTVKIGVILNNGHEVCGSGVAVEPHLILTARHVILNKHQKIFIKDAQDHAYLATVTNVSKDHDLALLFVPAVNLKPVRLARRMPRVGDTVYACGWPLALFISFTEGMVNKLNDGLIINQCPIIFGNSGGPLINSRGELVGINVSIITLEYSWSGISVAEGIDHIREFLG